MQQCNKQRSSRPCSAWQAASHPATTHHPPGATDMPAQALLLPLLLAAGSGTPSAAVPPPKMVPIKSGSFLMGWPGKTPLPPSIGGLATRGASAGDADESPAHTVQLSAFALSATEVTNAQYELYDPAHRALRGRAGGFSRLDDEAVVFVSHENATRYAAWLAKTTGKPYRLPTEAEWEYAARGDGPTTNGSYFWTGDALPAAMASVQHIGITKASEGGLPSKLSAVSLAVGRFQPNSYGLHDTLGNVEEWCADWHGAYSSASATDPTGPTTGIFRVTRGGSHTTEPYYLRTANRHGALPAERNWYIGFRVALGGRRRRQSAGADSEDGAPPPVRAPGYSPPAKNVSWPRWSPQPMAPVLRRYVIWPGDGNALPFKDHNHEPTIAACPNGDFVAVSDRYCWLCSTLLCVRTRGLCSPSK
jgi:sulfatase modifying factor 1